MAYPLTNKPTSASLPGKTYPTRGTFIGGTNQKELKSEDEEYCEPTREVPGIREKTSVSLASAFLLRLDSVGNLNSGARFGRFVRGRRT